MGESSKSVKSMSFEEIYYSFIHAKGEELSGKGLALEQAKPEIESIGDELKKHVGRTEWKGAGGDAFREWGDAFAKQIIKLAHVAGVTGKEMVEAGGDIKAAVEELMKTPPGDISQCYADADKEKARLKAVSKLRDTVMQGSVKAAAEKCVTAKTTIQALEIPEFRPMPGSVGIGDEEGPEWTAPGGTEGGSAGGGSVGAPSYGANAGTGGAGSGSGSAHQVTGATFPDARDAQVPPPVHGDNGTGPVHVPAGHDSSGADQGNTGTRIDSGPAAPSVPTPTMPSPGTSTPTDPTRSMPPMPPFPAPPVVPGLPRPGRSGPATPGGPGTPPAMPTNTGRPGRSAVDPGRFGVPGTGKVPSVPRVDPGVIGGTPSTGLGSGTGRGMPRGTVIGGEPQQTGRGMMGMPGAGGATPPSSKAGGAGRRLATQPGGVMNAPSSAPGARREFTPGGSGLIRGGGAAGASNRQTEKERRRPAGPGYLTEDEETWAAGGTDNVPPVIQ